MAKSKSRYVCQACGSVTSRWQGQCVDCGEWNSLVQDAALAATVFGPQAADLRSEALMQLDLGKGRLPGLLAFGSEDPHMFRPTHGTDLLTFFAGVFERQMQRWLA